MDGVTVGALGASEPELDLSRPEDVRLRLVEAVGGRDDPVVVDDAPAAEAGGVIFVDEGETHHPGELSLEGGAAANDPVRPARSTGSRCSWGRTQNFVPPGSNYFVSMLLFLAKVRHYD